MYFGLQVNNFNKEIGDQFNVGIVCGANSNLCVIDIDTKNDGLKIWETLLRTNIDSMLLTLNIDIFNILNTFTVKTGGGGYHYYFKYTKCEQLKNHIGLLKCIDIRTQSGGQVVGPYSIHPITKQFYMPIDPMKEVSEIPDWLLNILLQASKQNNNNTINIINNNIQIDRNIIQQNSKNTIIDIENLFNLLSNERADNYEQ